MQNVAFIVIGLGILAFIGWAVRGFFMSDEIPLFIKVVVGAVAVGGVTLLGIAIKDRISQVKKEDFREVDK
jgi:hypothetical protein